MICATYQRVAAVRRARQRRQTLANVWAFTVLAAGALCALATALDALNP